MHVYYKDKGLREQLVLPAELGQFWFVKTIVFILIIRQHAGAVAPGVVWLLLQPANMNIN